MKKVIRNDLILESCSQKDHKDGCYIRFKKGKYHHSQIPKEGNDTIFDYNKEDELLDIEFTFGIHLKEEKQ